MTVMDFPGVLALGRVSAIDRSINVSHPINELRITFVTRNFLEFLHPGIFDWK